MDWINPLVANKARGLKVVGNRCRYGRSKNFVSAICCRIDVAGDGAIRSADQLSCCGPIPIPTFASDADACDVKVGVRDNGCKILVRSRSFAEEVARTNEVSFLQISSDSGFIKETRFPIERQRPYIFYLNGI